MNFFIGFLVAINILLTIVYTISVKALEGARRDYPEDITKLSRISFSKNHDLLIRSEMKSFGTWNLSIEPKYDRSADSVVLSFQKEDFLSAGMQGYSSSYKIKDLGSNGKLWIYNSRKDKKERQWFGLEKMNYEGQLEQMWGGEWNKGDDRSKITFTLEDDLTVDSNDDEEY